MTTIRLLPPADQPRNGRKVLDVPDANAAILARNGWRAIGLAGDKAYDSAALREWLDEHGTKPVIPNRANRKHPFGFDKNPTSSDTASRTPFAA
jgi:hypothetical protein